MSISTYCSYSVASSGVDFTFNFSVTSSSTITRIDVQYSGQTINGGTVSDSDSFSPVNTTLTGRGKYQVV